MATPRDVLMLLGVTSALGECVDNIHILIEVLYFCCPQDDFECICRKDFVWDQSTQTCKPINPCFPQSYIPCSKSGTLTCIALNMQTPLCICKPEYTGKDCGQLRNACLTRFNKTESNGNTNCGVIQGNLCNPILGTDFYRCSCGMGWVPSPTLSYDNCDILNDPCGTFAIEEVEGTNVENVSTVNKKEGPRIRTTIDCQNGGFCSSSPDNSKAACLCLSTASGDQGFTDLRTTPEAFRLRLRVQISISPPNHASTLSTHFISASRPLSLSPSLPSPPHPTTASATLPKKHLHTITSSATLRLPFRPGKPSPPLPVSAYQEVGRTRI
ncbi:hypothetical protein ACTXT7_004156 [Hymenolepis weldensis]